MKSTTVRKVDRDPADELREIAARLEGCPAAPEEDLRRLRQLTMVNDETRALMSETMCFIRERLSKQVYDAVGQTRMMADAEILKEQLGFETASPLEQMMIDHLVTARMRLVLTELTFANLQAAGVLDAEGLLRWEQMLSIAQRRFLRAVSGYTKLTKALRRMPGMQVNVAQTGSQQVNINQ